LPEDDGDIGGVVDVKVRSKETRGDDEDTCDLVLLLRMEGCGDRPVK
jgi:hypothetical protein